MKPRDLDRLRHMRDAAIKAREIISRTNWQQFASDPAAHYGVTKLIEIIGEAAWQLSEETRQQMPALPWPQIIGMRHHMVHAYFEIDCKSSGRPPMTICRKCLKFLTLTCRNRSAMR